MPDKLPFPEFKTEREEADWYYEHREDLHLYRDSPEGRGFHAVLNQLGLRLDPNVVTLALQDGDLKLAKQLAADHGMEREDFLANLLHKALETSKAA